MNQIGEETASNFKSMNEALKQRVENSLATKESNYNPRGLGIVRWVKQTLKIPFVCIGGITLGCDPSALQVHASIQRLKRAMLATDPLEATGPYWQGELDGWALGEDWRTANVTSPRLAQLGSCPANGEYPFDWVLNERLPSVEYLDEPLDEPDPGHILICCSRPTSNLVIEA